MAVEHAVTRSVRDSAALLDATVGPGPGRSVLTRRRRRGRSRPRSGRPPGRLRIAFTAPHTRRPPRSTPTASRRIDDAMLLCEALGHEVVEADLTALDARVGAAIGTMFGAATAGSSNTGSARSVASRNRTRSSR